MTDNAKGKPGHAPYRPSYMTTDWLASESDAYDATHPRGAMARLALHLESELAERDERIAELEGGESGQMQAAASELQRWRPMQTDLHGECRALVNELHAITARAEKAEAERDAARAEVEQVRKILGAADGELTWMAAEKRVNMHESAMRCCETLRSERRTAIDERDAARADIAAAQMILPAGCGSLADAADTMRQELEAARAEVERLANEKAELWQTIQRNEDRAAGIDPQPLNDDAILSREDIAEMVEQAKLKRGESVGRSMREIAEFEMVCTRSEYVSMANTMARLVMERDAARAEVDVMRRTLADTESQRDAERQEGMQVRVSLEADLRAAIRDRNEFAAQQVERFAEEFLRVMKSHGVAAAVEALPGAADNRAAELRAGAVPATKPKPAPAASREVCGSCDATSAKDAESKCRPDGDSCPGLELWVGAAKKPEPAAEPSNAASLIATARQSVYESHLDGAVLVLCDAVEALTREVRR